MARHQRKLPWKYVALDATGTLIRPRVSIGRTYVDHFQQIARYALSSERRERAEEHVNRHFPIAFSALSAAKPNFGKHTVVARHDTPATAFSWWSELILDVLPSELVREMPDDVAHQFTSNVYAHYASGEAWHVFDDVRCVLDHLRDDGVALGVISNFDERLEGILQDVTLREYFDVVTTSWCQGVMKPDVSIFTTTFAQLKRHHEKPSSAESLNSDAVWTYDDVLHVGDHQVRDYHGARATGVHARWLQRHVHKEHVDVPLEHTISSLQELLDLSTIQV
ncbi:Ubiquitin-specific protease, partial [Globisporangium splendens]